MKKRTVLCAMLAIASLALAQTNGYWSKHQAFKTSQKSIASAASLTSGSTDVDAQVVLQEDFSLFTKGTPEEPDTTNIAPGTNGVYEVNPAYTQLPHWSGYSVYQAGGCAALSPYIYYGYQYGGHISTPEAELYGEVTIHFRARRAGTSPNAGNLDLALCDNTSGRIETIEFELTSEWQDFSWTSTQATFNNKNIFQFTTMGGTILIDDIKVVRVRNRIPGVHANMPVNNSLTEFVASWERSPISTIDGYLFSLWRTEMPEAEISGSVSCDFESINLQADGQSIDTTNPGYPEGWTIDVSSHGEKDMCTTAGNYHSGKQGIHFDSEGDYILSPETPAPINKISFWVKPSNMQAESYEFSLVGVQVKDIYGEWEPIAAIPNYWMNENGGLYTLEGDVVGHYITQVRITCIASFHVTFAIDDITLEYATQPMPKPVITDTLITDTSCIISGIEPTFEHFYNVKVKEGNVISEPSNTVWVNGIIGYTPVALPATDITANSFVANWEEHPNADSYKVLLTQTETTTTDNQEVVVLEEDFSGITSGTINNPGSSNDLVYNLCEHGKSDQEWLLTNARWIKGMAGSKGTDSDTGKAGLVLSPKMRLGNNAIKIIFKAYNKVVGDRVWVLVMKEHDSAKAEVGLPVPFNRTTNYVNDTVIFDGLDFGDTPFHIAFMSERGEFYIDEVKISLIAPNAGTIIEKPFKSIEVTDNYCACTDLPAGTPNYAYSVMVKRTKDFLDYVSNFSNIVNVSLLNSSVEDIQQPATNHATKVISAGQLLILRDGKTYNAMGVEVK